MWMHEFHVVAEIKNFWHTNGEQNADYFKEAEMDEIEIVPYDERWPALYENERTRLLPVLDRYGLIEIAHIGSTAVPGLAAKPVIDIAISLVSLDQVREQGVPELEALGYLFWAENPDPDDLFL